MEIYIRATEAIWFIDKGDDVRIGENGSSHGETFLWIFTMHQSAF